MSAFTVTNEHIAVLLTAGLAVEHKPLRWEIPAPTDGGLPLDATTGNGVGAGWSINRPNTRTRTLTRASVDAVGQMLLDQNTASVNQRYSDDDLAIYTYTPPRAWRTPVEVLKALNCYRYQAGETSDWTATEAHHFCAALETAVINQLPGYDEAAWAIGRDTTTLAEQQAEHHTQ
jgi:hypothetical protein